MFACFIQHEDEIDDIDEENLGDPVQVSFYAKDIFNYYKEREVSRGFVNKLCILDGPWRLAVLQAVQEGCSCVMLASVICI